MMRFASSENQSSALLFSENSKAEIWFSEDANRIMVQLKADLPVGSLNLYLTSARPPTLTIPSPFSPP